MSTNSRFFPIAIVLLLVVNNSIGQVLIPAELSKKLSSDSTKLKVSEIYDNYGELDQNNSPDLIQEKKQVERWLYANRSRLNIENDSTYSFKDYSNAVKAFVESDLFCRDEDEAKWVSEGPFLPGHKNGRIDAIYMNPNNPNIIIIGTNRAGIFKTEDHGDTWRCVTDDLDFPVLGVRQICVKPQDANYLIALTGMKSGADPVQNGYLISNDCGDSWIQGNNIPINPSPGNTELNQIQSIFYHPDYSGLIIGATTDKIIISEDDGLNWKLIATPEVESNNFFFKEILALGDKVHLCNRWTGAQYVAQYWQGDLFMSSANGDFDIQWGPDIGSSLNTQNEMMGPNNPFNYMSSINFNLIGDPASINPSITGDYYNHRVVGASCNNYSLSVPGNWAMIRTNGWATTQNINNYNEPICTYTGTTFDDAEIFCEDVEVGGEYWYNDDVVFQIKSKVPIGAKLKVYASNYLYPLSTSSATSICNKDPYNYYGPNGLFENLLFDSGIIQQDPNDLNALAREIDQIVPLDLLSYNLPIQQGSNQTIVIRLYFVVEYNPTISTADCELHYFDIRREPLYPFHIDFSNMSYADYPHFYIHTRGNATAGIFKVGSFANPNEIIEIRRSNCSASEAGICAKAGEESATEITASLSEPDIYYHSQIGNPIRYNDDPNVASEGIISAPNGVGGHHGDYRGYHILQLSPGRDHILWGNDGGVAESPNSNLPNPYLYSLNGDLSINMIYNLDVHEKTKDVLIGLQDNNTYILNQSNANWNLVHGGDGCVTMIQQNYSDHYVVGDPQGINANALKDASSVSGQPHGIVDDAIVINREAYLGMRLEEYRHHPERFLSGFERVQGTNSGFVYMNQSANQTEKQEIENSVQIGDVAICQRIPDVAYACENMFGDLVSGVKLYKTIDNGNYWEVIHPQLEINNGSSVIYESIENLFYWKFFNSIAVDHVNPNRLYVGLSGVAKNDNQEVENEYRRVLRSNNGGSTFIDWSEGLPALPVNKLLAIESSNHLVFAATDGGIFYRSDDTDQWVCFNNNLPLCNVTDLVYLYCSKELYASTYGRGVWKTPVDLFTGTDVNNEITSNTVWDAPQDIRENVLVKSGNILTITSVVTIDADRKLIIEPGAKLILDGGTLTNECGAYWSGIEVMGNSSQPQSPLYQGHLITRNGARIEYAREAIQNWEYENWNATGGIIHCSNTKFLNNRRSAAFYTYHDMSGGQETIYDGFFQDCEFVWDDAYIGESPAPSITMYDIYGVRIEGCDFTDRRAVLAQGEERPIGIQSLDAGYKVLGRPLTLGPDTDTQYSDANYDVSAFRQLKTGVHAMNANSQATVFIDHSLFEDCLNGVTLEAVDNAVVTRNRFDYTTNHYSDITTMSQLNIIKSTAYKVEGNEFDKTDLSGNTVGTNVQNSGAEPNNIYRNFYSYQNAGNLAVGFNRNNADIISQSTGLQWLCNQNENNYFDLYDFVYSPNLPLGFGEGVRLSQGTLNESAGNTFSQSITQAYPLGDAHISHSQPWIKYYDNETGGQLVLNGLIDKVNVGLGNNHECLPEVGNDISIGVGSMLTEVIRNNKLSDLQNIDQEYNAITLQLNGLLQMGDQQSLHDAVANMTIQNRFSVIDLLEEYSPYLSESLLMELGNVPPNILPHTWYVDIVRANMEIARSYEFMNYLSQKSNPIPNGLYDQLDQDRMITFTERGEMELGLLSLRTKRAKIYTQLIANELSDSTTIDWSMIKQLSFERNLIRTKSEIADNGLSKGDVVQTTQELNNINANIHSYKMQRVKQEMIDFTDFKNYILSITNNTGKVQNLSSPQKDQLLYMASNFEGKPAQQAQNLLCFLHGICNDIEVPLQNSNAMMMQQNNSEMDVDIIDFSEKLEIVPNPNTGEFRLEVPNECEIHQIVVTDLNGKAVGIHQTLNNENTGIIQIQNAENGIYLIKVTCNEKVFVSRVLVE